MSFNELLRKSSLARLASLLSAPSVPAISNPERIFQGLGCAGRERASLRLLFAYTDRVPRELTAVQVLTVILQRLEKRATCLEAVQLSEYTLVARELRHFARMVQAARNYLAERGRRS